MEQDANVNVARENKLIMQFVKQRTKEENYSDLCLCIFLSKSERTFS